MEGNTSTKYSAFILVTQAILLSQNINHLHFPVFFSGFQSFHQMWSITIQYYSETKETHNIRYELNTRGLVETSGEECHQVCRQLEPTDTVKIITLAPVIAVFTQGN